jgi:hypothetical protein
MSISMYCSRVTRVASSCINWPLSRDGDIVTPIFLYRYLTTKYIKTLPWQMAVIGHLAMPPLLPGRTTFTGDQAQTSRQFKRNLRGLHQFMWLYLLPPVLPRKIENIMLESLDKTCCIQYNQVAFSIIPGACVEFVVPEEQMSDSSISACTALVARSSMSRRVAHALPRSWGMQQGLVFLEGRSTCLKRSI